MSGHKRATITVSQDEISRLYKVLEQIQGDKADLSSLVSQANRQTRLSLEAYYDHLEQRQQAFLAALQGVNQHLAEVEAVTSQALLEQQAQIQQNLAHLTGRLWDRSNEVLLEIERRYQEHVQSLEQRKNDEILWLTERFERLATNQQRSEEIASRWLEAAQTLAYFVHSHYDHERFLPGELGKFEQRIGRAAQNLQVGLPQAALPLLQEAYLGISDLRLKLERLHAKAHTLLSAAAEYALFLEKKAHQNETVPAVDLEGNLLPYNINVDFWVNGELHALIRTIEEIRADLAERPDSLTIKDLQKLLNHDLPNLERKLEDLIFQARLAAISSQLRLNIADCVLSTLYLQGYRVESAYFEQGDARRSYSVQMCGVDGSQIIVRVDPLPEAGPQNELHLIATDGQTRTIHEIRQHSSEIQRGLQLYGWDISRLVKIGDQPQDVILDRENGYQRTKQHSKTSVEKRSNELFFNRE